MNRSAVREIQGIGRFKFGEGELEQFKRLSAQLMEIVRSKDTGTVQYEIYFNHDQSEGHRPRAVPGLRSAGRARRAPWRLGEDNPGIGIQRAPWSSER